MVIDRFTLIHHSQKIKSFTDKLESGEPKNGPQSRGVAQVLEPRDVSGNIFSMAEKRAESGLPRKNPFVPRTIIVRSTCLDKTRRIFYCSTGVYRALLKCWRFLSLFLVGSWFGIAHPR